MRKRTRILFRHACWRIAKFVFIPLILFLLLNFLWHLESQHRLNKILAQLKEEDNFTLEDSNSPLQAAPPVVDDLQKAAALVKLTDNQRHFLEGFRYPFAYEEYALSPDNWDDIEELVHENTPALTAIDIADTRKVSTVSADFGTENSCMELALYAASVAYHQNRPAECLQNIRRLLIISEIYLREHSNEVPTFWYSLSAKRRATQALEYVLPYLSLSQQDGSLKLARQILPMLADSPESQRNIIESYKTIMRDTHLTFSSSFDNWLLKPLRDDDVARTLQTESIGIPGLGQANWQDSQKILAAWFSKSPTSILPFPLYYETHLASQHAVSSSVPHYVDIVLVTTRASALLLAAKIFETERHRFPKSAAELVPAILPKLPVDPFASDGRPLQYRLDRAGPTVWSVGENGVDEGGIIPAKYHYRFRCDDFIYGWEWIRLEHQDAPTWWIFRD